MSLEEYLKHVADEAAKAVAKTQGSNAEKEAETSAKNVEAEGVKETLVEGVVHSDSSATESDDPTKIAPTSYVSGKQKYKGSPKKKKDSDEEDSTYVPTPDEKKKLRKKRKAHPKRVVPRSVRARKGSSTTPEVETTKVPEVEKVQSVEKPEVKTKKAPESPIYERVEKDVEVPLNIEVEKVEEKKQDDEVEFMGERKSTPLASPINPTIHIHDDPKKTPEEQPKKATTSSSSHGFRRVIGEYPEDLPEGDYDLFNEGKINVLTKKVSVLEKEKAKTEADREELKEKLEASKAENAELKKANHSRV
ncbi:hypothetical protein Hanom_Chr13g01210441 [Helianthus anomalus]